MRPPLRSTAAPERVTEPLWPPPKFGSSRRSRVPLRARMSSLTTIEVAACRCRLARADPDWAFMTIGALTVMRPSGLPAPALVPAPVLTRTSVPWFSAAVITSAPRVLPEVPSGGV